MSLLLFISVIIIAYLTFKLKAVSRLLSQLVNSAEQTKPLLLERTDGLASGFKIDRLIQAFNRIIEDNAKISATEQSHLDQIRTTLGNLREAVIIVDKDNSIRLANKAFKELVEAREQPTGRRLETFIQGSAFQEFLRTVRSGGQAKRTEIEVSVDNRTLWLEVSAAALDGATVPSQGLTLFVIHDITRQKKLEKMRTEFVANVSHELKTPVTIIKGFADTLVEDHDVLTNEERLRFLSRIQNNSERLHHLLQDLLLLSRLESMDAVLQRERLSISALVTDIAEGWGSRLNPESQRLKLTLTTEDDIVFIDPLRINQVITNLLDNALKHAKNFSCIEIITTVLDSAVNVQIKDNGEGIPEKDLPHIFQRFYRVEKGRSRESGGTGLGLSIVKHIIQQHGGELLATSKPGEGTTISFTLPFPEKMAENAVFRSLRKRSASPA